jgi:hypothetical protein
MFISSRRLIRGGEKVIWYHGKYMHSILAAFRRKSFHKIDRRACARIKLVK